MPNKSISIEHLSVHLDKNSQDMVTYLLNAGYGQADLIKAGIELLYKKEKNTKAASIPSLLNTFSKAKELGPKDLSNNRKKYYKELMVEKHTG